MSCCTQVRDSRRRETDEFDSVVGTNAGDEGLIRHVLDQIKKKKKESEPIYFVIYPPYVPLCMFRYAYPGT